MTSEQENKCHAIIHSAAIAAGAGNVIPVPGSGFAVDTITLTLMTAGLAGIFGGSITEEGAKGLAISTFKKVALQQPIRYIAKELSKLIPGLGQIVAPAASIAIIEAAGWAIASELEKRCK